ncbi:NAD(P)H-dependent amine dehydrogenase family protein [Novosphingobium soli]|uniref:Dihydrodipicolinate reductase n=1 Tax=Novosphingobium soli TaxID=574956 RepID=A0ABV6CTF9_9SPHN
MSEEQRHRVAQWGTGNVGLHALRAIIEHPGMELVALRVFSGEKLGRDAGELLGGSAVGVRACGSLEEVLAARPDCVVYLPNQADVDDMCGLLEAGANVVTGCIGFNRRDSLEPAVRARLEAACAAGGTSLYATGSSPGWATELMPLTLLAMQRHFESLTITDFADMASRNSPLMLQRIGFGARVEDMPPDRSPSTVLSTTSSFRALAEAVGLPLDAVTGSIEYARTRRREEIAGGVIEAGTIGAVRMGVFGVRAGRPILRRYSTWYVTRDLDPGWALQDSGWRVEVRGDTSLDVSIAFDVAPEDYAAYSPGLTAHPLINAAPHVIAAKPGILETRDLPVITPRLIA